MKKRLEMLGRGMRRRRLGFVCYSKIEIHKLKFSNEIRNSKSVDFPHTDDVTMRAELMMSRGRG